MQPCIITNYHFSKEESAMYMCKLLLGLHLFGIEIHPYHCMRNTRPAQTRLEPLLETRQLNWPALL